MSKNDAAKVKQISSTSSQFAQHLHKAQDIVDSWPEWKKSTRATSYPRPSFNGTCEEKGHNLK